MSAPGLEKVCDEGRVMQMEYPSFPVTIPVGFLLNPTPEPITVTRVDFENSPLSEYENVYATVLDGVLSQEECDVLIELARKSAVGEDGEGDGWQPALLRSRMGGEVLRTDVRHSDRIIWDTQDIAERIFKRCMQAEGLQDDLSKVEGAPLLGYRQILRGEKWRLVRLNERLRFLRYGVGHYFKSHCDGSFTTPDGQRSFYTLHLYLNTLPQGGTESPPPSLLTSSPPSGGSTTLLPPDHGQRAEASGPPERALWVAPRAGRVLIFQQKDLRHDGQEVRAGVKVTMRTEFMFELESKSVATKTE